MSLFSNSSFIARRRARTVLQPVALFASLSLGTLLVACGDDGENEPNAVAGAGGGGSAQTGAGGAAGQSAAGGAAGQGGSGGAAGQAAGGGTLSPLTPPVDPGPGAILVTVSGEDLAVNGYDFQAGTSLANGDPPAFVDGWELRFDHVLVTIAGVRMNASPDKNPADPTDAGELVAEVPGAFAIDLHAGGAIVGKSGSPDEKTVAIGAIAGPKGGGAFDAAQRYAFSYETTAATTAAQNVNLDASAQALYATAIERGWSMVMKGTATYKGKAPAAGSVFEKTPSTVAFTLGLANPTSYVNCRNTDLQAVGDEFPRGVQVDATKSTTVQLTMHLDHVFWSQLNTEGTPLHFDQIAVLASTYGQAGAPPGEVTMVDLEGADFTAFKTRDGEPLPARSEVSDHTATGQLFFDPNGASFPKNSYARFLTYSAMAGGHLNADGECEVVPKFTP